ncbi:MAG: ABC transporter permease [Gemmatimonadetes bacterium]|nr:ABC transporter permease [Gemmatimonadota bacterium]
MAWHHELRAALAAIFRRRRQESELADEVRFHLEMEAEHRQAVLGEDRAAARRAAARAFGGVERHKEDVRDERGAPQWEHWRRDIAISLRSLRLRPAFTTLVVATLALGIGATTTLFGVANAVLLRPLPYAQPDAIAVLWSAWKGFDQTWLSWDEYEAWDTDIPAFDEVALFSDGNLTLTAGDVPERIRFASVSARLFPILGVAPLYGRNFTPSEDRPNGERVIMLSYTLWERLFNADPAIVGQTIQVDGSAATVVGVMPQGFKLPLDFGRDGPTLAWMPNATDAASEGAAPGPAFNGTGGGSHGWYGVARLAPGATIDLANRQLAARVAQLKVEGVYVEEQQFRAFAVGVTDQVTGRIRPVLLITLGAVVLLLLIACANVAALLLVRGEHRRRELAVRVALGAGAARLNRLLLTESTLLALLGGLLGLGVAALGAAGARRFAPAAFPRVADTEVDATMVAVALLVTMVTAVLAGIFPALHSARVAPSADLRDGGKGMTASGARLRWRQGLVTMEIALAVVLVVGAGLMVRTVRNLLAVDRGFDGRGVLSMQVSTPSSWYGDSIQVASFWRELTRQVAELPGVRSAGAVRQIPLASEMGDWGLQVEGYTPPPNQGTPGDWQVVTPGYFETMGLRLREGRFLDARDDMEGPLAMVVNQAFVRAYLTNRTALGTRVQIGGNARGRPPYAIVGVVDDVRHNGLTRAVKPQFYATLAQFALSPGSTRRSMHLVLRAAGDPTDLVGPARQVIRGIDPRLPVSEVQAWDDVLAAALAEQAFAMRLLSLFGVLSLGLALLGVFGVVAQVVAQRRHEFGIRAALGATPLTLVRLSLGTGLRQVLLGLAVGVAAALLATRLLGQLLHGVGAADPLTFATVAALTAVATLAASLLPAWRVARQAPSTVLFEG